MFRGINRLDRIETEYKKPTDELIRESALRHADKIAVSDPWHEIRYMDLERMSNVVCHWLLDHSNEIENGIVGILIGGRVERVVFVVGVLKAGMTFLPMDIRAPLSRNSLFMKNAGASYILCDRMHFDDATSILIENGIGIEHIWSPDCDDLMKLDSEYLKTEKTIDRIAYIIHTSGSTGIPKGVCVPDRALNNLSWNMKNRFCHLTDKDKICAITNFSFDFSIFDVFPFLLAGAWICYPPDDMVGDIERLNSFMIENGVTVQSMPTGLYNLFVELENLGLRLLVVGGEKMVKYRKKNYAIINGYGPTEATVFTACENVEEYSDNIPIGHPLDNVGVLIVKDNGQLAEPGEKGEICIVGDNLACGYINDDEETRKRFVPSLIDADQLMYRSGDIGTYTADGRLLCFGRSDNQIKYRGFRIELDEINTRLSEIRDISESAVIFHGRKNKHIAAFYSTKSGEEKDVSELRADLLKHLPDYMIPSRFFFLEFLPKNNNGKTDRNALAEYMDKHDGTDGITATSDDDRSVLKHIWAEALEIDDDFDESVSFNMLGGYSVLGLMMISEVRERFNIDLSYIDLMTADTFEDFSGIVVSRIENDQMNAQYEDDLEHRYDPFPLHKMQQAYYIGRKKGVELGGVPTHMYLELEVGSFERTRLMKALNRLFETHDALRIRISDDATQRVVPFSELKEEDVPYIDLRGTDEETLNERLDALREEMDSVLIDYSVDPLIKIRVIQIKSDEAIVQLYIDGCIADGWSQELLIRDLDRFYGDPETTKVYNHHLYRDYVIKTLHNDQSSDYEKSKQYWNEKIDDLPGIPELPLRCSPSVLSDFHISHISDTLNNSEWEIFRRKCSSRGLTTSDVMLTVFSKVIALWSRKQDFVLSFPVAQRFFDSVSFENTFGTMSDFFVFDVHEKANETILQTAVANRHKIDELMEHSTYCGMDVVREMSRRTGNPGNLAPVVFTSFADMEQPETRYIRKRHFQTHTTQVWIDVVVLRFGDQIQFCWDYVKELFEDETISSIEKTFMAELRLLIEKDSHWDDSEIIPVTDIVTTIDSASGKVTPGKNESLNGCLDMICSLHGKNSVLFVNDRVYTYEELFRDARRFASYLKSKGVRRQDIVAILMDKCYGQIVGVLGTVFVGAVYMPLDTQNAVERIRSCMSIADSSVLITDDSMLDKYGSFVSYEVIINMEDAPWSETEEEYICDDLNEEDLYAIIFTSGSTGVPKGVKLPQKGLMNCVNFTNREILLDQKDKVLSLTNLAHDMSIYDIFGAINAGAAIVLPDKDKVKDPRHWADLIEKYAVTIWNSVPTIAEMMLEVLEHGHKADISSLRCIIWGGEVLPPDLCTRIRRYAPNCRILNVGGPTETTIWSIMHQVDDDDLKGKRIPLGKAIDNVRYMILNDNLRLCPYDVPGTMYVSGISLSKGYINAPDRTAERFVRSPFDGELMYNTGDIGKYLKNGDIDILGREDDQIKLHGKRIELGEIEATALTFDPIKQAVVSFDKETGKIDLFYKADEKINDADVRTYLQDCLPDYMLPAFWVQVDCFETLPNGKINRRSLPHPVNDHANDKATSEEALTYVESEIRSLYEKYTGMQDIDPDDDFYSIGGDSLVAVRLSIDLSERFDQEIDLADIFIYPTVREMAEYIQSNLKD